MIRLYKDAPTKVDLLKTVVLIEKSVESASPLVQEQFQKMKAALRADKFKEAAKFAKLISVAGKSGNPAKIAKARALAKALIERVKQYEITHENAGKEKEYDYLQVISEIERGVRERFFKSPYFKEFINMLNISYKQLVSDENNAKKFSFLDEFSRVWRNISETYKSTCRNEILKLASKLYAKKYGIEFVECFYDKEDVLNDIEDKGKTIIDDTYHALDKKLSDWQSKKKRNIEPKNRKMR